MIETEGGPTAGDDSPRGERPPTDSKSQKTPRHGSILRWIANAAYAGLLIAAAMIPSAPKIVDLSPPDWLAHGLAYGLQSVLLYWAALPGLGHRRALAVGFVGAAAFGTITEALQSFQPRRTVEIKDLLANVIGAALACGGVAVLRPILPWSRR